MYKAVLVDEDSSAIHQVNSSIPWTEFNVRIVGTAKNGLDALELAHKVAPDIMFLAVEIPKMDGLSLIAALRNEFPKMQITILSKHADFRYAQRGIELGITRYLVKPSSKQELMEAMGIMVQRLQLFDCVVFSDEEEVGDDISDNFIVQNAMNYMEEHYNEHLSLPMVAENIFVSQWHLSKLISKTRNESFNESLNGIRINRAKELLEHTNLQIQEISSRVGFSDATHFARVFKKQTGESANQYRNRVLAERNHKGR